jgi:hypothetical protein
VDAPTQWGHLKEIRISKVYLLPAAIHRQVQFPERVMVAAIGSPSSVTPAATTSSGGSGLKAELARVQKEYSACVNCASANTDAGRRNIQQLDIKIQQIQSRIEAATPVAKTASVDTAVSAAAAPAASATRIDTYA